MFYNPSRGVHPFWLNTSEVIGVGDAQSETDEKTSSMTTTKC